MAEYRMVSPALWSSPDFQALGLPPPCPANLWLYLLTSPAMCIIPGVVRAGPGRIAEEIDPEMSSWTPKVVADLLNDLQGRGMLRWDRTSRTIWLINALGRKEHAPNDNQVRGWRTAFDDVPRSCPFLADLWAAMEAVTGSKSAHLGDKPVFEEGLSEPSRKGSETLPEGNEKGSGTVSNSVTVTVTETATVSEDPLSPTGGQRSAGPKAVDYVEAWNQGIDDAAADLGKEPRVKRGKPGAPPGGLAKAAKDHRDPDAWRWCAYALATSWEGRKEDGFDRFGLAWVVGLNKKRRAERMANGVEARERGRAPVAEAQPKPKGRAAALDHLQAKARAAFAAERRQAASTSLVETTPGLFEPMETR